MGASVPAVLVTVALSPAEDCVPAFCLATELIRNVLSSCNARAVVNVITLVFASFRVLLRLHGPVEGVEPEAAHNDCADAAED